MERIVEKDIEYNGEKMHIKVKRFTFKERNDLQRAATKVTMVGSTPRFELDPFTMKEEGIFRGLVEAPFEHKTRNDIYNLDPELAEKIWEAVEEANLLSKKKTQSSDGQSNTEQQTQS